MPSLDLAWEITARIQNGEFTWPDDFENLHPSPFGQRLYFESISRLLDAAWSAGGQPRRASPTPLPAPLDPFCYDAGRIVDLTAAEFDDGWKRVERWRPTDGKGTRAGFVDVPMLVSQTMGATLRLPFTGRGVGVWVAAGPDAGSLGYRIDEGRWERVDQRTRWSEHLHLPWLHVLAADLDGNEHVLELQMRAQDLLAGAGHAVRIAAFVVNGPEI